MAAHGLPRNGFFPWQPVHLTVATSVAVLYLIWTGWVVGLRQDHMLFLLFLLTMMLGHVWTRSLTYGFVFFILFWVIYDSMRILPNYEVNQVHIMQPYLWEKSFFGIWYNNEVHTPNEFLRMHAHPILDVLSGFFYLTWVPVPLALGMYLFFYNPSWLLRFSAAYLFANLLGFCLYYLYPAAPPWYVDIYGAIQRFDIPGNAAQLLRFDAIIGFPLFENMYTKNANVFAAIPSLHAAYPVITWYYARKTGLTAVSWLVLIDILGIWFAAVYSFHHYIIDVLLGALCAVSAIILFERIIMAGRAASWLHQYESFMKGHNFIHNEGRG
jgi:hypothetical protein